MPVRWRMIVLLPAPLGPTRPYTEPPGTVMSSPSSARKPSNSLTTFLISIIVLLSFQALRKHLLCNADVAELRDELIEFAEQLRAVKSLGLVI